MTLRHLLRTDCHLLRSTHLMWRSTTNCSWPRHLGTAERERAHGKVTALQGTPHLQRPSLGLSILAWITVAVLWILFVGGTRIHEMLVGLGVLLLTGLFLFRVGETESLNLKFGLADILTCWRIPWYFLSDTFTILLVLLKDLAGAQKAGSFYRFSGFKTAKDDPRLAARRVLATAYTTVTPNAIVIGIDVAQSRMLFHQLQRSEVSRMTKELGAQPGVERS